MRPTRISDEMLDLIIAVAVIAVIFIACVSNGHV